MHNPFWIRKLCGITVTVNFFSDSAYGPCDNYKKLGEANRAAGYGIDTGMSDRNNDWKKEWYRFTGDAGEKMADM